MTESIRQARVDVQSSFDELVAWAVSEAPRTFFEFEKRLRVLLRELGCALVLLFIAVHVSRSRPTRYRCGGRLYELNGERASELGTHCGKVLFRRPIGRQPGKPRGTCDLPVDRELGLVSGFSLEVVQGVARLCALMAFAVGRTTYREFYGWTPSPRACFRMVDALGSEARPFLEGSPRPDNDGSILVVQVDAKGAPMISEAEYERRCQPHERRSAAEPDRHRRRRRRKARPAKKRKKGEKSKNAKMAVVGVIYTLQPTAEGVLGPINKRVYATFDSHEELFIWLAKEAEKRGYGTKRTIFLADGSEHIWHLQKIYFAEAETCLDWFHLVEHLWTAGRAAYAEGSNELRAWVGKQARRLRRGATTAVRQELWCMLQKIPRTGPGNKARRKRLQDMLHYYDVNNGRMRYNELRKDDLDIGTGAIEGAVRNLVGMRLDGPGMRWGRLRSERVLHLRCILLNDQWDDFVVHLSRKERLALPAQPEPTVPHNAKKAA